MTALELLAAASAKSAGDPTSRGKRSGPTSSSVAVVGEVRQTQDATISPAATTAAATATATNSDTSPDVPSEGNNNSNNKARSGGHSLQFPWKLHEMLDLAERNGREDVISWLGGGKGFRVHKKEEFCSTIMPSYFSSTKYKTFQRSLNLWGFESVSKGSDRGACYHPYFLKGQPDLCHSMTRIKIKGQPSATAVESRRAAHVQTMMHSTAVQDAAAATLPLPQAGAAVATTGMVAGSGTNTGEQQEQQPLRPSSSCIGGNDQERRPSLVSAYIRGKTYHEAMTAHHQAAAMVAAAGPTGLGFMGGGVATTTGSGLLGFSHAGYGGLSGMGLDPALSSFYGAHELMARRASMERHHHAMALATLLTPPPPDRTQLLLPGQGGAAARPGGSSVVPSSSLQLSSMDYGVGNHGGALQPSEMESAELVKARAAELAASATHVLQL